MAAYYEEFINPFLPAKNAFVIRIEHLGRYLFAKKFLQKHDKGIVWDIACGDGYGVRILSNEATIVIGFDNNKELLSLATSYHRDNVIYISCDIENESINRVATKNKLSPPDVIVSFEIVEHIANADTLLSEFYRMLPQGGYVLLSTPNALLEPKKHGVSKNIFHKKIYTKEEMQSLFEKHGFIVEKIYGQAATNNFYHKFRFLMELLNTLTEHMFPLIYIFTLLLGMPRKDNFEKSYSMIFVAKKKLLQ